MQKKKFMKLCQPLSTPECSKKYRTQMYFCMCSDSVRIPSWYLKYVSFFISDLYFVILEDPLWFLVGVFLAHLFIRHISFTIISLSYCISFSEMNKHDGEQQQCVSSSLVLLLYPSHTIGGRIPEWKEQRIWSQRIQVQILTLLCPLLSAFKYIHSTQGKC